MLSTNTSQPHIVSDYYLNLTWLNTQQMWHTLLADEKTEHVHSSQEILTIFKVIIISLQLSALRQHPDFK